jgi:hypothetical protein
MVKRSRAAVRPGQRRPIQRRVAPSTAAGSSSPAVTPADPATPAMSATPAARPSAGLTAAEARRAEQLEAEIRADERAAEDARKRAQERGKTRSDEITRPAGSLAVVAAHEYDYVVRDVRRIGITAAILLFVLFLIWLAVEVGHVISI